jgi:hypothetical protein
MEPFLRAGEWRRALARAIASGSIASFLSTVALALCGRVEHDDHPGD